MMAMKTHVYKLVLGLFITLFAFNLNAQDIRINSNFGIAPNKLTD